MCKKVQCPNHSSETKYTVSPSSIWEFVSTRGADNILGCALIDFSGGVVVSPVPVTPVDLVRTIGASC